MYFFFHFYFFHFALSRQVQNEIMLQEPIFLLKISKTERSNNIGYCQYLWVGKVSTNFAAAKNGKVGSNFSAAKNGQVSSNSKKR